MGFEEYLASGFTNRFLWYFLRWYFQNKPEPPSSLRILKSDATELTIEVIGPSDNIRYYKIVYYPEQPVPGVTEKVKHGKD